MADQVRQASTETEEISLAWVKSSASGDGGNDNCTEVARTPGHVHVRDSKHPEPTLTFSHETWLAFLHIHS
ncbi:DUF397 domain-containing protein [Amycolatopsis sp. RTGN1]|uniref:DUF397 domain-containing protein n=1 Tax=Amycolatopsis ponsaeliensis TaxID=2992142 RepID=UPI00254FAD48|nr:DUF397 domain-containing protein [Amycolatopsis sp. RTGN1]